MSALRFNQEYRTLLPCCGALAFFIFTLLAARGADNLKIVPQNEVTEMTFTATHAHTDPFGEVTLDAIFTTPTGQSLRVPAFWAGGRLWRIRYASPLVGVHHFHTECSENDPGLQNQTGDLQVQSSTSTNPLLAHGPIRIADDRHHFAHADGTPFFWLADTWWFGFCGRLHEDEFHELARQRAAEGFNVVKIVAGFCPDVAPFDEREANAGGHPWEKDFARINPAYFNIVDQRVQTLVKSGLVPSLVGMWGYYLPRMGDPKVKLHWRYLIARYGAYPVAWTLAGEVSMPWYLTPAKEKQREQKEQLRGWSEVRAYVVQTDPWRRPLSAHPGGDEFGFIALKKLGALDFIMLQPGHTDMRSFTNAQGLLHRAHNTYRDRPVMIGEACYEGILGENREKVQRRLFWSSLLTGAAGYCYGADGLWQINRSEKIFGASPTGSTWGDLPFTQASQLPGGQQLALGANLLRQWPWWKFAPHQDWISPAASAAAPLRPYAAGVPREIRVIYFPFVVVKGMDLMVRHLEKDVQYHAAFYDVTNGQKHDLGEVKATEKGEWPVPIAPVMRDWLLVLEVGKDSAAQ